VAHARGAAVQARAPDGGVPGRPARALPAAGTPVPGALGAVLHRGWGGGHALRGAAVRHTTDRLEDLPVPALQPKAGETPEQRADRLCADANYNGPWAATLQPLFKQACRKSVIDNGKELQQVFLHNVPRAMFIFLPLLAGLMMLMYWRPRHYYVEHLLLFVHNHAFVFLVAGMALLLGRLVPRLPGLNFLIFLYFAWYMYRSMRVVYQQGRLLTVSKLLLLASFYLLFASLLAAITSVYSAFTL
jgi:hypothetical protein